MRKKTWNTLATDALAAVMASPVITGCQREQSIAAQTIDIQAEGAGKADTEATGESKGSEDVRGIDTAPIDNYPASSLTIICPAGAGGGTDLLLRAMAPAMEEYLRISAMVVNKPGGGFAIGYATILQDSNDDNSISVTLSELLGLPCVADVSFDYTDFEPIYSFNSTSGALSANSSAPHDTVGELVEYYRASPNAVRIGNSRIGGVWHILVVFFAQEVGIEMVHVPLNGGGSAAVAVASNNVEAVPVSTQEVQTYMGGGTAEILCFFSLERLPELPDVLTGTECDYPAQMTVFRDFLAPKGMSKDAKVMIDAATGCALVDETAQGFMKAQNCTNNYINADELKEMMDKENAIYAERSKALGITVKQLDPKGYHR